MKKISGRIFVRETNLGIPNLVVAAYDSEKSLSDIINENYQSNKGFDPKIMSHLGRRIGSVLSCPDGTFLLNNEELQFQGTESRPDLLLIVFAPEDILEIDMPYPQPPEKRILYISTVPRTDAGAEEVYIIRLLQSQLDKFQIPAQEDDQQNTKALETQSTTLSDAIERSYQFRDDMKQKLSARLKDQESKTQGFKEMAKNKVKNLSALPLSKRDHPYLLNNTSELQTTQEKSIKDGLGNLNKYKPSLTISLNAEDIKALGITGKNQQGKVDIDNSKLVDLLNRKTGGLNLIRSNVNTGNLSATDILNKYLKNGQQISAPGK